MLELPGGWWVEPHSFWLNPQTDVPVLPQAGQFQPLILYTVCIQPKTQVIKSAGSVPKMISNTKHWAATHVNTFCYILNVKILSFTNYNTVDYKCTSYCGKSANFLLLPKKNSIYRIFPLYDSELALEFFNPLPSYFLTIQTLKVTGSRSVKISFWQAVTLSTEIAPSNAICIRFGICIDIDLAWHVSVSAL